MPLTWNSKQYFGKPGYAQNVSDTTPGHVSSFRCLPLDLNAYTTGGWTLTKADTYLYSVKDVKILTRTPEGRAYAPAAVMPEVIIANGQVTIKLNKVNGASFSEVSNGYTGPAGSVLWLEIIGMM